MAIVFTVVVVLRRAIPPNLVVVAVVLAVLVPSSDPVPATPVGHIVAVPNRIAGFSEREKWLTKLLVWKEKCKFSHTLI